jgi:hypothetical protein
MEHQTIEEQALALRKSFSAAKLIAVSATLLMLS